ncbi:hypothetical protein GDO81_025874, partial [Engystomops pustulosus]
VLYQNGISLQDLFLFISCCSIFHILRTLFLMPDTHIPFPVPEGYRYGVGCAKLSHKTFKSLKPGHNKEETVQKTRNTSTKSLENHGKCHP